MSFPTNIDNKEEFDHVMIERKLSGIYATVQVEIPYESFTEMIEIMTRVLDDEYGIDCDTEESFDVSKLAQNPDVVRYFEQELQQILTNNEWSIGDPWDDTGKILKKEIKAFREKTEKEAKERAAAEEAERQRMLAEGQVIVVKGKDHDKAVAILRAAGLLK